MVQSLIFRHNLSDRKGSLSLMRWNWQQSDWPNFRWDRNRLEAAERQFLLGGGVLIGTLNHLPVEDRQLFTVEAMSTEAVTTSEIEGEILDRISVQSSIRRQLGLSVEQARARPAEQGVAEMMVDLYQSFAEPLSREMADRWHKKLFGGRRGLKNVGAYRSGKEPMQVVSGPVHEPRVHFEAPPSDQVKAEMQRFFGWFEKTKPGGAEPIPALARAGIAHIYFESIHPFEDGNGRIGRAISEKSLGESVGQPTLISLAATILLRRKSYYEALEAANKKNEVTDWLAWFAGTAIEGQRRTVAMLEFLIDKTKLFDRLRGQLNERQVKALSRMFREGPEGFQGGLNAGKYSRITGASPATTTRDLLDLVEKGALRREGELRHARYHLTVRTRPVKRVAVNREGQIVGED